MAADVSIRLSLQGAGEVDSGLNRVNKGLGEIGGAARGAVGNVVALGSALGAAFSVRAIINAADSVTVLNNQLKLVTGSTKAQTQAYNELFEIAQRSRVSFTELGGTYASIARAGDALGISQQRLLGVTEAISNAVTVSGGSAESAKAALVQLSQGLASGTLRGDELNSVMEQTPRLAKALADGLGITTGELRKLGAEGEITAAKVIQALESQSVVLKGEVATSVVTVGQAWTVLTNASVAAVGEIDKATGASASLASAMQSLAGGVTTLGRAFKENETVITTVMGVIGGVAVAAGVGSVVTRITALTTGVGGLAGAFTLLNAAVLANPVTLTLLGIGAVVGGSVAYLTNQAKTVDGIRKSIEQLNQENERSAEAMTRATAGGRTAGADNISRLMAERTARIKEFQAEMQGLQQGGFSGVDTNGDRALERADKIAYENRLKLKKAFDEDYFTAEQKAVAEIKKQRESLGDLLTPADEAKIRAKYVKPTAKADTGLTDSQQALKSYVDSLQKAIDKENDLTEVQKANNFLNSQGKEGQVKQTRDLVLGLAQTKDLRDQEDAALKASVKSLNDYYQEQERVLDARQKQAQTVADSVQKLREEETAVALAASENISLAQAIEKVALSRVREEQAKQRAAGADGATLLALQKEIESREELIKLIGSKTARATADDAAKATAADWQKTADSIERALTDSLMRGFESGKSLWTSLRDYVTNSAKSWIIKLAVQPIMGAINGIMGGPAAAGQAGGGGGGSGGVAGALSTASNLSTIIGAGSQFIYGASAGASAASVFGANAVGAVGGDAIGALIAGNGAWSGVAVGAAEAGAAAGAAAGGAAGATGAASGLSSFAAAAGPWIAGALAIAALADAMQYTVDDKGGAFVAQAGSSGTSSVALRRDFQQNGGLFGGGTTQNSSWADADAAIRGYFDTTITATTASVKKYAEVLGLAPEAVDGFKAQIEASITGLNPEQQRAAINKAIGGFVDSMITAAYGGALSGVAKAGETSSQTLERLAVSFGSVNQALNLLGYSMLQVGIDGATTAAGLIDAFGGLEKAQASVGAYYQAFYSDAEKAAMATATLGDQFEALGLTLPDSKEAFRALVGTIDISTDAGRRLAAAVINLAPAFDQAAQAAQAAAQNMLSALQNYGTSAEVRDFQVNQIGDALRAAGIGVDNATIAGGTRDQYRAAYEQFVASGNTQAANALFAQQQAFASITQSSRQTTQQSFGGGGGGDGGGSSPVQDSALDAWQKATDAIVSAMKDLRVSLIDTGPDNFARLQAQFAIDAAKAGAGDLAAYQELEKLINPLVEAQKGVSTSGVESAVFVANLLASLDTLTTKVSGKSGYNLPSFDVGTNYVPSDMLAMIHEGEAIVPKAYNPAANNSGGNGALVDEVRALRAEIAALRTSADQTAANTKKTATTLEDSAVGARPFTTVAA